MILERSDEAPLWYAMSAPYRRNEGSDASQDQPGHQGVPSFGTLRAYGGAAHTQASWSISYRPVVRNLLFVKATPRQDPRISSKITESPYFSSSRSVPSMDILKSSPSPIRKWRISWRSTKTWRMPTSTSSFPGK